MSAGDKKDRRARLLRVEHLLYQYPRGLRPREIADLCEVCVRTTYRDLAALQSDLCLPIWQDEQGRYGVERGHYLPPVRLTLLEATALFISARLACKYSDERDTSIESAFTKLAFVLPPPIAEHVQETVRAIAGKTPNPEFARVFEILASAWANRQRVRLRYTRAGSDGPEAEISERLLDPYFIEPSAIGHACYVIGFDHRSGQVRTFKLERIRGLELTSEEYSVPENWSARDYLRSSWGVVHDEEVEVQVRFSKAVAARVRESIWHPSQELVEQPDGTILFRVRVAGTLEITPWLLSWGAEAEVLSPPQLRAHFAEIGRRLAQAYASDPAEASLAEA